MPATPEQRLAELKGSAQMPSPDGVALEIAQLALDGDLPLARIVKLAQTDPALTGRLIQLANSAALAGGRPVVSVQEAIRRLGLASVRNVALALSLMGGEHGKSCVGFDYRRFWSHSLACGIAAKTLPAGLAAMASDEIFTLGLLSGIGRLALASVYPVEYAAVLAGSHGETPRELLALEREAFAVDHAEVTAAMLADWRFPTLFVQVVLHHANPEAIALAEGSRALRGSQALSLASCIADLCVADDEQRTRIVIRLFDLGAGIALDESALTALTDAAVVEWHEWGRLLDVDTRQVPAISAIGARGER